MGLFPLPSVHTPCATSLNKADGEKAGAAVVLGTATAAVAVCVGGTRVGATVVVVMVVIVIVVVVVVVAVVVVVVVVAAAAVVVFVVAVVVIVVLVTVVVMVVTVVAGIVVEGREHVGALPLAGRPMTSSASSWTMRVPPLGAGCAVNRRTTWSWTYGAWLRSSSAYSLRRRPGVSTTPAPRQRHARGSHAV